VKVLIVQSKNGIPDFDGFIIASAYKEDVAIKFVLGYTPHSARMTGKCCDAVICEKVQDLNGIIIASAGEVYLTI